MQRYIKEMRKTNLFRNNMPVGNKAITITITI